MLEEGSDTKSFDHAFVLHYGDIEPILLERPLKDQGLAMEKINKHSHCQLDIMGVYESIYWVDRYMTDMEKH